MPGVYSKRAGAPPAPPGAVYVGRPGPFGNPFVVGVDGSREECVRMFEDWIREPAQEQLLERVRDELAGWDLVCWCAPLPCHAEVLLAIANGGAIHA